MADNHSNSNFEYDIAYFSAQPLMKDDGKHVAGEVDVVDWAEKMLQILHENGKQCNYIHQYATLPKLSRICVGGTKVLSITFHGSKDSSRLCLEDQDRPGLPKDFSREEIINALGERKPQLVVIVSKHAEPVANFFAECGIPHVVGMRYHYNVQDTAVETFQKNFYKWILGGRPVTYAFTEALKTTKKREGVDSWAQEKFFIFGRGVRGANGRFTHDVVVFPDLPQGKHVDKTERDGNFLLPRAVSNFVGRYKSLFDLVSKVTIQDITWVHGVEGWGKTALAVMAAHYLKERKCFKNILYVDFTSSPHQETPEKIIAECLQTSPEDPEDTYWALPKEDLQSAYSDRTGGGYADYLDFNMITTLNGSFMTQDSNDIRNVQGLAKVFETQIRGEILLILDHVCQKLKFSQILKFCYKLLSKAHNVKILVCSRIFNADIFKSERQRNRGVSFASIELKPLNMQASKRLLQLSLHKHILRKEFPQVPPRHLAAIVNEHPCGWLSCRYYVPLAVKRIAHRVNSNGVFLYLTSHHMEEIVSELLPFHVYLHHQGGGLVDKESFNRSELVKSGLPAQLRAPWAMDILHTARMKLQAFREKFAPEWAGTEMQPQIQSTQSFSRPSPHNPYPSQMRSSHTSFGPTPGLNDSHSFRQSNRQASHVGSELRSATSPNNKMMDMNDIDDSSDDDENPFSPMEGPNATGMTGYDSNNAKPQSSAPFHSNPSYPHNQDFVDSPHPSASSPELRTEQSFSKLKKAKSVPVDSDPREWSCEDLADWIEKLGAKYGNYRQSLVENGVDGSCILDLEDEEFQTLGFLKVHAKVIQKKFRSAVDKFTGGS